VHDTSIDGFRRYSQIREALCQQILTAIDPTYYNVLKDATFGYADLTVVSLLSHLEITYATLSADDLEFNHMHLADAWTPDEPLEQANVYAHSLRTWHDRASNDHTWANFCSHFIHRDKEHLPMLTATTAGYHGAHAAIQTSGHTPSQAFTNSGTAPMPSITSAAQAVPTGYVYNNLQLGYCWTQGLTKHPDHTSATCYHPSSGHQLNATLDRCMGGWICIFGDGTRTNRTPHVPPLSSAMVPVPTACHMSPHCPCHLLDIEGRKLTSLILSFSMHSSDVQELIRQHKYS